MKRLILVRIALQAGVAVGWGTLRNGAGSGPLLVYGNFAPSASFFWTSVFVALASHPRCAVSQPITLARVAPET